MADTDVITPEEIESSISPSFSAVSATINARAAQVAAAAAQAAVAAIPAPAAGLPTDLPGIANALITMGGSLLALAGEGGGTPAPVSPPTTTPSGPAPAADANVPVKSAYAFVDSIGFNTHTIYTDGAYAWQQHSIIDPMAYLGLVHIRDHAPDPSNQGQDHYSNIAGAGLKFCMLTGQEDVPTALGRLQTFEQAFPGAIALIEGPNEVNNSGGATFGQGDGTGAEAYQTLLMTSAKAIDVLKGKPVLIFTDNPYMTGAADAGNFHSYAKDGAAPAKTLANDRYAAASAMPGKPLYCTETGYQTGTGGDNVSPEQQAAFLLLSFVENFNAGVVRTYGYELIEDRTSNKWGVFSYPAGDPNANTTAPLPPKPAAVALKALVAAVKDTKAATLPAAPQIAVDGASALQLMKSDGSYVLLLWSESEISTSVTLPAAADVTQVNVDGSSTDFGSKTTLTIDVPIGVVTLVCKPA